MLSIKFEKHLLVRSVYKEKEVSYLEEIFRRVIISYSKHLKVSDKSVDLIAL